MAKILKSENDEIGEPDEILLHNLNIMKDGKLKLGGLLVFGKNPQKYRPVFCIKAVSFFGNFIGGTDYLSSKDFEGYQRSAKY
ncbi:MAG: hypothetical protein LC102_01695 [Ignavibacteriales bacterium]|nr:MAG: hypothetical protein F9K26_04555 [Ignavibacteriaceae bacterium]MBW7873436.1 hypothetical protein [Ignavibacteria bacterium]MCZ2142127.1 hypothetical protein [Ignavibacteriales bacterium]OQY75679.1 MAG: hypothetical protein B6D45_05310 [Ignavibacteriales bacterium UTCHB3]MBV6444863.1 hypothetical protein [Ignavibacteriaceae bacterium]